MSRVLDVSCLRSFWMLGTSTSTKVVRCCRIWFSTSTSICNVSIAITPSASPHTWNAWLHTHLFIDAELKPRTSPRSQNSTPRTRVNWPQSTQVYRNYITVSTEHVGELTLKVSQVRAGQQTQSNSEINSPCTTSSTHTHTHTHRLYMTAIYNQLLLLTQPGHPLVSHHVWVTARQTKLLTLYGSGRTILLSMSVGTPWLNRQARVRVM